MRAVPSPDCSLSEEGLLDKRQSTRDALTLPSTRRSREVSRMKSFARAVDLASQKLGSCRVCTAKAFWASAGAWFLAFFMWPETKEIFAFAGILTVLWALHIFFYALKATRAEKQKTELGDSASRRDVLHFIKVAGLATAGSIMPLQAFAMGSCGSCGAGRTDYHCFRDGYDGNCYRCRSCGNDCGDDVC